MATRTSAQEERIATLRSVMNVIAILDQTSPRRAAPNHGFDLRPLLPRFDDSGNDDCWDDFQFPAPQRTRGTEKLG
jgi:hypothetical protein